MKFIFIALSLFAANIAGAWDCSLPKWQQSTNPQGKCYVAPTPPVTGHDPISQSQGQGQAQIASGGSATATGGQATGGSSNSAGYGGSSSSNAQGGAGGSGTGGSGGSSDQRQKQEASASNAGNNQSSSTFVAGTPPIAINPVRIVQCGVAFDLNGAGTKGAGAFGMTFTTEECWNSNYAAMEEGAGRFHDACEMRRISNTERRAIKNGAKFEDCVPTPPVIIKEIVKVGPTEEEIESIKQHAIAEYIFSHPEKPCPAPKHSKHYAPCKMQPTVEIKKDVHIDIDTGTHVSPPQ